MQPFKLGQPRASRLTGTQTSKHPIPCNQVLFQSRLRLNTGISVDHIDAKCLAATATPSAAAAATSTTAGPAEQAKLPSASSEVGVFDSGFPFGHGQQMQGTEPTASFGDDDEML